MRLALVVALCLVAAAPGQADITWLPLVGVHFLPFTATWATVTEIVDGDTIWVDLHGDGSGDAKVRYLGIDTREIHFAIECYAPEAKEPTHSPRRAKAGRAALFMRCLRWAALPPS